MMFKALANPAGAGVHSRSVRKAAGWLAVTIAVLGGAVFFWSANSKHKPAQPVEGPWNRSRFCCNYFRQC